MNPLDLEFSAPFWLLALPLALLPLWRRDVDAIRYSSLLLVPRDRLSSFLGVLIRAVMVLVMLTLILGLAGLQRPQAFVERIGRGAEIVMLLDRSRSMDEPLSGKAANFVPFAGFAGQQQVEVASKSSIAHRLLAEFAAKRPSDLFALVLFSSMPIRVMAFTQKAEMVQAAIKAGGVGRGLAETDMGRGLLAAAELFDRRPYAGSRLILLVSDGGAKLDPEAQEQIAAALKRNRIGLYWVFIRSTGSPGIHSADEGGGPSPERALHVFFEGLGLPYHAYEAEDREALKKAIADVARLENLPIQYQERLPSLDYTAYCYSAALGGLFLLTSLTLLRRRTWC